MRSPRCPSHLPPNGLMGSLYYSLIPGILDRDGLADDCVHRHFFCPFFQGLGHLALRAEWPIECQIRPLQAHSGSTRCGCWTPVQELVRLCSSPPALSETPRPPQGCSAPGSQQRREARNALALVAARGQFLRRHALATTVGETHAIGISACSV
jgi:hypothetical protein